MAESVGLLRVERKYEELTFERFEDLPLELRLMIWDFALPGPRVLKIEEEIKRGKPTRQNQTTLKNGDIVGLKISLKLKARSKDPALLHVNSESRTVALKKYELAFQNRIKRIAPFYIDYSCDVVFPMSSMIFQRLCYPYKKPVPEITDSRGQGVLGKKRRMDKSMSVKLQQLMLGWHCKTPYIINCAKFKNLLRIMVEGSHDANYYQRRRNCSMHQANMKQFQDTVMSRIKVLSPNKFVDKLNISFADLEQLNILLNHARMDFSMNFLPSKSIMSARNTGLETRMM